MIFNSEVVLFLACTDLFWLVIGLVLSVLYVLLVLNLTAWLVLGLV